ncbi:hypothetical protein ACH5RR_018027 [Cinchona calisaya]|uniref:Uncharacterized protein n=1 Tax=Cinchona calisaya TaxID=153742 RepID=A0ABD2ZLK4_9GENT
MVDEEAVSPSRKKATLEEIDDAIKGRDFNPYYFSDEPGVDKDPEIWAKYFHQIEESDGFDIYDFPGVSLEAPITPITGFENYPETLQLLIEDATAAINDFNKNEATINKVVKVEKANSQLWGVGFNSYVTFQAQDTDSDADTGSIMTTFQALVWVGPAEPVVKFCRLKSNNVAGAALIFEVQSSSCQKAKKEELHRREILLDVSWFSGNEATNEEMAIEVELVKSKQQKLEQLAQKYGLAGVFGFRHMLMQRKASQ